MLKNDKRFLFMFICSLSAFRAHWFSLKHLEKKTSCKRDLVIDIKHMIEVNLNKTTKTQSPLILFLGVRGVEYAVLSSSDKSEV